jgi:hypothetical protein
MNAVWWWMSLRVHWSKDMLFGVEGKGKWMYTSVCAARVYERMYAQMYARVYGANICEHCNTNGRIKRRMNGNDKRYYKGGDGNPSTVFYFVFKRNIKLI